MERGTDILASSDPLRKHSSPSRARMSSVDLDNCNLDGDTCRRRYPCSHHHHSTKVTGKQRLLKLDLRRRRGTSTSYNTDNGNGLPTLPCLIPLPHHPSIQPLTAAPAPLDENELVLVVKTRKWPCTAGNIFCKPKNGYRRPSRAAGMGGTQNRLDGCSELGYHELQCAFWEEPVVQAVLTQRKVRLADSAGL